MEFFFFLSILPLALHLDLYSDAVGVPECCGGGD
jgi:hypothetical protein